MRVSVVIPAYNAEPYLHECLSSVLTQTHPVEEVIVIDDGSTDRTRSIAESFGSPVRLLQQKQGGPARARNLGVKEARGEWIAFLDADDLWLPDKVRKQLSALAAAPEAVLCYTGLLALKLDGSRVAVQAPSLSHVDAMLSLTNVGIPPSAVMLRRETLLQVGGFSDVQKGCEDWDLWFRLRKVGTFCIVPEAETVYRESLGGLSSNAEHMYQDFLRMLDRVLLADKHGWQRHVWRRRIMSYQQYKAAMTARHAGQSAIERKFLAASLATWPSPLWHPERFAASLVHLRRSLTR
ncbi:glycosyltransferase family A protein [Terriglobus roseus]|uniref:Glycosyl transferase family 2 n=1 Tax=Terriglobus roseus TaxID=392734 RepID=A0A1H4JPV3_9BACT|nr:glycosyltransferase family A protein [Terriglobus roseus]SEB47946.1 Glycosyl transferase family 2 [Terriglobus roseus]